MASDAYVQIGEAQGPPLPGLTGLERLERLRAEIRSMGSVVVAYSGGVDSSLLLAVAHQTLGDRAWGVIGRSDSYAESELALALAQAAKIGARVDIVSTGELKDPRFRANTVQRCYHCKSELYGKLTEIARATGAQAVDGTIADDLTDWRPGRRAAGERGIRSPLAELGFGKADVRAAAERLGLESHDKPASPCLASRIPYGTEITRENLSQVEHGEELLHALGFREARLRHHGAIARIEVPLADLARLSAPGVRERVVAGIKALGFRFVALDLEGFRSGSLNEAAGVPVRSERPGPS